MPEHGNFADENERVRRLAALDKGNIPADGGPQFNRLIFSVSPYLLQHAENPVDWYEWGDEAFAKARAEDKPIFLSIGYATCHWCHVMAHESFEDRDVATVLNRHFIPIKVDREERPDIDDQYMAVAQMISGSGGWPLTIMMTPEKEPFFAATYIPKERRMGMPGIVELLERVSSFWRNERDKVEDNCAAIMASLERQTRSFPAQAGPELEEKAYGQLLAMYDRVNGGFSDAPKFPMPHYISFLLRMVRGAKGNEALEMAEKTLLMMRQGGIYDQIGFGVHRYSTDSRWLVPHFEKMLYDQALVALAAAELFQLTGSEAYGEMVREILDYVMVEMTSPEGGFCSAQDADSEGEEGKFYLWTPAEVKTILGQDAGALFCRMFQISERGNFEGRNIPYLQDSIEAFAHREGLDSLVLKGDLVKWRGALLSVREKRVHPLRDTKVITAWNGLLIAALAKGYAVSGDESYFKAADRAVSFVNTHLRTGEGRLLRSYHLGQAKTPAFLEDYAFFVWGLIEMFQVSLQGAYLAEAAELTREMMRLFGAKEGGFYDTGLDGEELLFRQKNAYDGALPSGNSVAAMNLVRLGRMCNDAAYEEAGEATIAAFSGNALQQPAAYLHMVAAHDYLHRESVEVTLVGDRDDAGLKSLLRAVNRRFIPGLVLAHRDAGGEGVPGKPAGARSAAYVCAKARCFPPVSDEEGVDKLLSEVA